MKRILGTLLTLVVLATYTIAFASDAIATPITNVSIHYTDSYISAHDIAAYWTDEVRIHFADDTETIVATNGSLGSDYSTFTASVSGAGITSANWYDCVEHINFKDRALANQTGGNTIVTNNTPENVRIVSYSGSTLYIEVDTSAGAVVTAPTCTEGGYTTYTYTSAPGVADQHDFTDALGHTPSDWIVVAEATCTEAGSKQKICTVCEEVLETETIPALGHDIETVTVDATCEEAGSITETCTRCDYENVTEIPALGHTPSDWIVVAEATCAEAGSKQVVCTVCEEVLETETIPALGHDIETVTVDATCGEDGTITKTCTCCNHEEVTAIAATGKHTYGDWTVTVNPTASKVGEKERICSVCGAVETGEVEYIDTVVVTISSSLESKLAPGAWLISEVHLEYQGGWKYMWANSWNGTQWKLSFSGMNSETWETYLHGLTIVNTNIFDKNDWLDIGSYNSYTISNGVLTLNYN